MTTVRRAALILAGSLILVTRWAEAQTTCPAATPRADAVLNRLLTSPEHADTRQEYGVGAVSATAIRKLVDATDAATCQRLNEVLRSQSKTGSVDLSQWQPAFYSAGGLLYIVVAPKPPAATRLPSGAFRISLRWTPTYIVDPTTYTIKAGIAM